jgi:hypothetical protein
MITLKQLAEAKVGDPRAWRRDIVNKWLEMIKFERYAEKFRTFMRIKPVIDGRTREN